MIVRKVYLCKAILCTLFIYMSAMPTARAGRHTNHAMVYEDVEGQEGQACWADTIVARLDSICTIPLFDTS